VGGKSFTSKRKGNRVGDGEKIKFQKENRDEGEKKTAIRADQGKKKKSQPGMARG
jgi:hypothetical protein